MSIGQVAHDDMEAQGGAVVHIAETSGSAYLTSELPGKIAELATRAQTNEAAEAIGNKLDETSGETLHTFSDPELGMRLVGFLGRVNISVVNPERCKMISVDGLRLTVVPQTAMMSVLELNGLIDAIGDYLATNGCAQSAATLTRQLLAYSTRGDQAEDALRDVPLWCIDRLLQIVARVTSMCNEACLHPATAMRVVRAELVSMSTHLRFYLAQSAG